MLAVAMQVMSMIVVVRVMRQHWVGFLPAKDGDVFVVLGNFVWVSGTTNMMV